MTTGEVIALIKAFGGSGGGGSSGGVLVVGVEYNEQLENDVLDKTWKEISDASLAIINDNGKIYPLCMVREMGGPYVVGFASYEVSQGSIAYSMYAFVTDSENGYPVYAEM